MENAVRCTTLKELRRAHGDYDVLKLDLENMESNAIKGDMTYIQRRAPVIWAECNEDLQSFRLAEMLLGLGYQVKYLAFPLCRQDNFREIKYPRLPFHYEAALVAAPPVRMQRLKTELPFDVVITRPIREPADLRKAIFDTPAKSFEDWAGLSRPDLIGRMMRMKEGQALSEFLPWDSGWG